MTLILVSGTRHALSDVHRGDVEARLSQWRPGGGVTLVHGDAAGVDRLAGFIGVNWGWNVVAVPAQWQTCAGYIPRELGGCPPNPHLRTRHGRTYCPYAGHRRNQHMLDEHPGADLAVCFPAVDSGTRSGTGDFIDRAIKAGLPFQVFPLTVQRPTAPGLFSATPAGSLPSPESE